MKINKVDDLEIWSESIQLATRIYKLTFTENFRKDYGLVDQIRRSSVSVSSNIAEGFERGNNKEFRNFLRISKGSLIELRTQLMIANKVGYVGKDVFTLLNDRIIRISNKIGKLIIYLNEQNKSSK